MTFKGRTRRAFLAVAVSAAIALGACVRSSAPRNDGPTADAGQTNADAVQETSAAPTRDEAVDETREDAPEVAGESERAGEAYLSGDVKIVSVEVKEKNSATGCEIKVSPSPTSSSRARSSSNQSPPTASGSSSAKA